MILLTILGVITLLLLLLSFIKLTVQLDFLQSKDNEYFKITLSILFGLISYTIRIPYMKWDDEEDAIVVEEKQYKGKKTKDTPKKKKKKLTMASILNKMEKFKHFLDHIVQFNKIVRRFLQHISVTKLEWRSHFGTGDAAMTAILTGLVWSVKGNVIGLVSKNMKLKTKPVLEVVPSFQQSFVETRVVCMFSFRIGYAMGAAFRTIKFWKGRQQVWQNIQSRA